MSETFACSNLLRLLPLFWTRNGYVSADCLAVCLRSLLICSFYLKNCFSLRALESNFALAHAASENMLNHAGLQDRLRQHFEKRHSYFNILPHSPTPHLILASLLAGWLAALAGIAGTCTSATILQNMKLTRQRSQSWYCEQSSCRNAKMFKPGPYTEKHRKKLFQKNADN